MLRRLFPQAFNNHYNGMTAALWIFGLLLALKILQNVNVMFQPEYVAITADGIPLSNYPAAAKATTLALFSLLGWAQLLVCSIGVIALVGYRSMIPLLYCVMVTHYLVGRGLLMLHPIERTGAHLGTYINMGIFALMVVGLALSLTPKASATTRSTVA